ncbi:hypothetical protein PHMEG_00023719 [Phytophthora megakarya]|uniref:Uncharacterized protein n=1 Tax=Phytophthora megakarya TaxID=4795 RepID=A0A225VIN8_9STRA|nr:hypothetical protein PHMEG_00023719 [Phytophthora megakarya]
MTSYIIGPPATTDSQRDLRDKLLEHHLTPQTMTNKEYVQRLIDQYRGKSVPAMNTITVVLRPGENLDEADARFQNWVERARKFSSIPVLRASFSKRDIYLERRLLFKFAKLEHQEAPVV